ncbi:MAG TPA: hypothetical protein VIO94_12540, partial [Phenylobacterium sp.]
MAGDLDLLAIEAQTTFVLDADGRMLAENEPAPGPAPKLFFAGSAAGNALRLRHDVQGAAEIERLAASEPPFREPGASPRWLARYRELLEAKDAQFGLSFELPRNLDDPPPAAFVLSGSAAGEALLAKLEAQGPPAELAAMGFAGPA